MTVFSEQPLALPGSANYLVVVADNDCWEDNVSETGRDALDRDEDGEVKEFNEVLPVEVDRPDDRDQDDDNPEEPPRPAEVLFGQVEPAVETCLLTEVLAVSFPVFPAGREGGLGLGGHHASNWKTSHFNPVHPSLVSKQERPTQRKISFNLDKVQITKYLVGTKL